MLVDIHNHILPGLDDGPKSIEEALLLATDAVENGITHIIATPHHHDGKYMNSSSVVEEAVFNFNKELYERSIPLEILPGQETHIYNSLISDLNKDLLTLANSGKYILIELPINHIPTYTFDILFQIQLKGYIPIIVHPERNMVFRKDKQKLYDIVNKGSLVQVTASSLIGVNGRAIKRYIKYLVKHNIVHFISSDSHHHIKRPFLLKAAYQYVREKFSEGLVSYYSENAKHVINGTSFQPKRPISFKKGRD
ncbi:tyrosine-protein phosphatase [Viridibacillus sp. FSL R5-0888]|uniref:tyrosine-protein phosphatase n=1 Tax=Viridibacillus sp. FSL R5-0888 TaxID=2921663 RepID=UPI0030F8F6C8